MQRPKMYFLRLENLAGDSLDVKFESHEDDDIIALEALTEGDFEDLERRGYDLASLAPNRVDAMNATTQKGGSGSNAVTAALKLREPIIDQAEFFVRGDALRRRASAALHCPVEEMIGIAELGPSNRESVGRDCSRSEVDGARDSSSENEGAFIVSDGSLVLLSRYCTSDEEVLMKSGKLHETGSKRV